MPTETDSVVINGDVVVTGATITGLTVSSGATLVNHSSSHYALTVNGNVINNGTVSNNDNGYLFLNVAGNLTNNGKLNNYQTTLIGGDAIRKINATTPIESSNFVLDSHVEIVGSAVFTGSINFNGKQLTINQPNTVSFGSASGTGIFQGMGTLKFTGSSIGVKLTGKIKEIIFEGQQQQISGELAADNVVFGGSGPKIISDTTTIHGSISVSNGVTLVNRYGYSRTLTVNGNVINNGTVSNNDNGYYLSLKVAGNLINNGKLNNYQTTLIGSDATRKINTSTPIESSSIILDTNVEIIGSAIFTGPSFNGKQLTINQPNTVSFGSVSGSGIIQGTGTLKFTGSSINVNLTGKIREIIFEGQEQQISGELAADNVVFGGSGQKIISDTTTIHGSISVSNGVTLVNRSGYSRTLTVNGNVINNGTVSNNDNGYYLSLKVAGNLTNNGKWTNYQTTLIGNDATRKINTTAPISSTIVLESNVEMVDRAVLTGSINFNGKQLTINQPNTVSFGSAYGTGILQGMGTLRFTGSSIRVNLTGKIKEIIFEGQEQQIYGELSAEHVVFGGSGKKFLYDTIVHGSITVNQGVTLVNHSSSSTLTVNGNVINNGTISNNDNRYYLSLKVAGNLTNNGKWTNYQTTLIGNDATRKINTTAPISSTIVLESNVEMVGRAVFTGQINFNGKQLTINQPNTVSFGSAYGTGILQGTGTLKFTGSSIHVNLTGKIKEIIFEGQEQQISGELTADNVVFGGSGQKIIYSDTTTIHGSISVSNGVTLVNRSGYSRTLTINGNVINNGTISNNEEHLLYLKVAGNIINNGEWSNYQTLVIWNIPDATRYEFKMTGTDDAWPEPLSTTGTSYNVTPYLNSVHHWWVRAEGGEWSEKRGINDPSLVTLPEVPEPSNAISGFIRTPNGQGIANIPLCISGTGNCEARTDATGHFTINADLPNGDYTIRPVQTDELGTIAFTPSTQVVTITGQAISGIDFIAESLTDDHGNEPASATLIQPNDSKPGRIETLQDQDYFRVELPTQGILTITMTTKTQDTIFLLQNSTYDTFPIDEKSHQDDNFRISTGLEAGTYYITVSLIDEGDYVLNTVFTSGALPNEQNPDASKICQLPSDSRNTFNTVTQVLNLPFTQMGQGNIYSITLHRAAENDDFFEVTDYCFTETTTSIPQEAEKAVIVARLGKIYLPAVYIDNTPEPYSGALIANLTLTLDDFSESDIIAWLQQGALFKIESLFQKETTLISQLGKNDSGNLVAGAAYIRPDEKTIIIANSTFYSGIFIQWGQNGNNMDIMAVDIIGASNTGWFGSKFLTLDSKKWVETTLNQYDQMVALFKGDFSEANRLQQHRTTVELSEFADTGNYFVGGWVSLILDSAQIVVSLLDINTEHKKGVIRHIVEEVIKNDTVVLEVTRLLEEKQTGRAVGYAVLRMVNLAKDYLVKHLMDKVADDIKTNHLYKLMGKKYGLNYDEFLEAGDQTAKISGPILDRLQLFAHGVDVAVRGFDYYNDKDLPLTGLDITLKKRLIKPSFPMYSKRRTPSNRFVGIHFKRLLITSLYRATNTKKMVRTVVCIMQKLNLRIKRYMVITPHVANLMADGMP